ncbi:2-oxoacid:acceptor oxidoreductase subunit alpha [candidate division KSB1 bacterium]|nr:2-oxoacid:acceptor oxidoreductase subunit alpha [candidate division KSB1 bacterium]
MAEKLISATPLQTQMQKRQNDMSELTLIIGGNAGQGLESSGAGFCKALNRGGLHVFSVQDNRSRIRGGHNFYLIKTSTEPIVSWTEPVHLLIALTAETVDIHLGKIVPGGAVVYDPSLEIDEDRIKDREAIPIPLPLYDIAGEAGGSKMMANTAALGAVAGLTNFPIKHLLSVIEDNFRKKGDKVININKKVAESAHDHAASKFGDSFKFNMEQQNGAQRMVMNGNEAISLGALVAGCNFVSAYPMTPGSSIFEWLNKHADEYGIVSKQAEDEIAAVCMSVGAAHVGARALVPTSGGGFSLMVEALGLAGMLEEPIVIVLAQRPGPSTSLATRTEQADLLYAINASQGEFPRIVIAPGTIEECYECGGRALNLAEKYQTPVILMTDQFLATSNRTLDKNNIDLGAIKIDRGALLTDDDLDKIDGEYKRYKFTENGISPRALPGHQNAIFKTTSDEHNELGEIVEAADNRIRMNTKRMKKLETALADMNPPKTHGLEDADITFVCWGSTLAPLTEAMNRLNNETSNTANIIQFIDLFPMPVEKVMPVLKNRKRLITVEGNYTAQLGSLLQMTTGVKIEEHILKFDGRPFSPEYILEHLKKLEKRGRNG